MSYLSSINNGSGGGGGGADIADLVYVAQTAVVTGTRDGSFDAPYATLQDAVDHYGAPVDLADYNRQVVIQVLDRAVYAGVTLSTRRYNFVFPGGTPTGNWTMNIDGALRFGSAFSPTVDIYSASRNLGTQIIGNFLMQLTGTTVTNIAVRFTNINWTGNVTIADGTNGGSSVTTGTASQLSLIGSSISGTFLGRNTGVAGLNAAIVGNVEIQAVLSSTNLQLLGTSIAMYGTSTTTRNIQGLTLLSTGGVTWNNVGVSPRWVVDDYTLGQLLSLATVTTNQFTLNKSLNVYSSDAGATGGFLDFYHNSASPAANDEIGVNRYYGNDSAGNKTLYADTAAFILDPTNGTESGGVIHYAALAGVRTEVMRWGNLDANFKGLAVGTVSPIDPSGSNVTRFQAYNAALNACVVSIGGGGGSGNTFVIFDAGTTARQIRMGYISGYGLLDFVNMPASGALVRASNASITYQCGVASSMIWGAFGGAEFMRINASTGDMGVGTGATISARIHAIKTTEQLRLGYDVNNYLSATVGSTGSTTFNLVGTSPEFIFTDPVNIQSSLQCDSIVNDTGLAHGTYTPTGTGVTNVSAITPRACQYSRVGNTVTVSGQVDVTATTNNARTTFRLSLPIASNFANSWEAGGGGYTMNNTVAGHGIGVYADATNNEVELDYFETHGGADTFTFNFTYQVI